MKKYKIYTDGSCKHSSGKGGWGAVIQHKDSTKHICGGEKDTTSNRMELMAVIKSLEELPYESCYIDITVDSRYVLNGITKWIFRWMENGWITSKGKSKVKNIDLWKRLHSLVEIHIIKWHWVKAHNGHPENEEADKLAKKGIGGNNV